MIHFTQVYVDKTNMTKKFQFDTEAVRQLASILIDTGLTEIECETEGCRIYVSKQTQVIAPVHSSSTPVLPSSHPLPSTPSISHSVQETKNFIKSPMVGTVYVASEPGSPAFIKVGDNIKEGQTLLIIEAMKVMNPLKSTQSGKIIEILVKDGTPVEYGQPLLVIE